VKDLCARNAGRYKFVELTVVVTARALAKGHQISEEIEHRIKKALTNVDRVIIHYEPRPRNQLTVGVPLCDDRQSVSEHFGEAPYFRLVTVDHARGELGRDAILRNPFLSQDKAKGIKVAQWLLQEGLDRIVVRRDLAGRGPGFVFGDAEVEVLVAEETEAERALSLGGVAWERVRVGSDCGVPSPGGDKFRIGTPSPGSPAAESQKVGRNP
jgi:predicted Fe-Mo cluster-binding NifX family protein